MSGGGTPCPQCGGKLTPLGAAKEGGKWEPNGNYRCAVCPSGSNRFAIIDSVLVPVKVGEFVSV